MSTLIASPSSADTTSDTAFSRCCICYNIYNRTDRAPISMPCGHTFCHGCIRHMTTGILFSWGVCRTVSPVGWNETKKNVALIQALEKLNLLASDDTDETLDSTPLGSNPFLGDEIDNVDSKNMVNHGKESLKVLSEYLESNYDDAHDVFRPIHDAIALLEIWEHVAVELEKDEPMDYSSSEQSDDEYVFDLVGADVNDIFRAVHGDDGDAMMDDDSDENALSDIGDDVAFRVVVNDALDNAEQFNFDDDANNLIADIDAGDTVEETDNDSVKISAFWASINAEKTYFSMRY